MAAVMVASLETPPFAVTFADSAALHTLGLTADRVIGRDACELLAASGTKPALLEAMARGWPCRLLTPQPAANGCAIERQVTLRPLVLNGAARHALVCLEDATPTSVPEGPGQLAIMDLVSHELRSPLNSALTWVSLLEIDRSPKTIERALAVVKQSIREQSRLIDDLVEVGRAGRPPTPLDTEAIDLRDLVEATVDAARAGLTEQRVLHSSADGGPFAVDGDRGRLSRAIAHLLGNAIKFIPAGGAIVAHLSICDGFAVFDVCDEGVGLAPEEVAHTFTPFWRAQPKARGGGLGLGVVRSVTLRHGGAVCARSAGREQGATFTITLPLSAGRATGPTTE